MLTKEGHILLTDAYIKPRPCTHACSAPELLSGCPPSPSADCWNLGIMLYQMVAGKYPFFHDDASTIYHNPEHDGCHNFDIFKKLGQSHSKFS